MNEINKEFKLKRRIYVKQLEEKLFSGENYQVVDNKIIIIFLFLSLIVSFFVVKKVTKIHNVEKIDFSDSKVLQITFFDVRQGDSALVTFPSGKSILIDAGAAKGMVIEESDPGTLIMEFDAGKKVLVPYIRENNIDLEGIIISHHHSDHFGGILSLIEEKIYPRWIMDNGMHAISHPVFLKLLNMIKNTNIDYRKFKLGKLKIDPDVDIEILAPMADYVSADIDRAINNYSIVLKITYKNFSVLFTGDIETFAEMDLLELKETLRSTVLKVAHHGSATSTSLPFLSMVLPEVAVISCGRGNPFGHPHDDTKIKLEKNRVKIYRTDYNGNITIKTDGEKYKVNVEKEY